MENALMSPNALFLESKSAFGYIKAFSIWRFYDPSQVTVRSRNRCCGYKSSPDVTWSNGCPDRSVAWRNQRQGFLADDRGPLRTGRDICLRKLRLERASIPGRRAGTQGDDEARPSLYRRRSRAELHVRGGIAVEAGVRYRHPAAEHGRDADVQSALRHVSQPRRLCEQSVLAPAACGPRHQNDTGGVVYRLRERQSGSRSVGQEPGGPQSIHDQTWL